jgi:hypothetical protein
MVKISSRQIREISFQEKGQKQKALIFRARFLAQNPSSSIISIIPNNNNNETTI